MQISFNFSSFRYTRHPEPVECVFYFEIVSNISSNIVLSIFSSPYITLIRCTLGLSFLPSMSLYVSFPDLSRILGNNSCFHFPVLSSALSKLI